MTELLQDGTQDFLGGQDASKIPSRIPVNSYQAGVNLSVALGVPTPRWGYVKKKLTFPDENLRLPNGREVPYENIFRSGRFQALIPYTISAQSHLLIVISGVIFLVNHDTFEVDIITLQGGGSLNENTPRLNWSNAGKFLVIFDYPNYPVILEGITARRADPTKYEVPVSTIGAYNQNRLFIGNAGQDYTAGDPTGSLAAPDAPVTFKEVLQPAAPYFGQLFSLPTDNLQDTITAMGFLQFVDTSTGIGPLIMGTAKAVYAFQAQTPRADWDASTFGKMFISSAGIVGQRALCNVNTDIFFLSSDGQLRTASMSRQEQSKWSRTPISREVQNWLVCRDPTLLPYSVVGYFNNKVLVSANPYRVPALNVAGQPIYDVAFGGFVVLELDNLATLGKDAQPAWAGLWTGARPLDIAITNEQCFVMSKDEGFSNQLYEMDPEITYDVEEETGLIRYAPGILYSREYDFENAFQNKDLQSLDLGIRNVKGDFSINVKFKPSHGSQYVEWRTFNHKAPWRVCGFPSNCNINGLAAHSFLDLTIGDALQGNTCDPVSNLPYNLFRKLQLRFQITGAYWELQEYRLKAVKREQNELDTACQVYNAVELCKDCNSSDWAIGAFRSCLPPVI